jgi:hypothetical protein
MLLLHPGQRKTGELLLEKGRTIDGIAFLDRKESAGRVCAA